jgi:hypothetical protein
MVNLSINTRKITSFEKQDNCINGVPKKQSRTIDGAPIDIVSTVIVIGASV